VRASFQTPEDATVILQISRLEPHKGQLAHLEALALLRDLPAWVCWQVGSVQKPEEIQYFEDIKNAAVRLGIEDRVRFLGWQPDVQKLIAAADIYCQPNIYPEPFGITFIEALYARKPVVATSLGGPKEIVDDSCGFLIAPNDAPLLADTLRELIGNERLRNELGAAGPLRAQRLCDPATQMRQLRAAFLSISRNGHN
jgi:glycosyltransferase involved in cell wall biosynthesis